jgi:hypothetical protein
MPRINSDTNSKREAPPKAVAKTGDRKGVEAAQEKPAPRRKHRTPRKDAAASTIGPGDRNHMIAVAAFYIAERRGFHGDSSHEDWLQAEREIDAMISAGKFAA